MRARGVIRRAESARVVSSVQIGELIMSVDNGVVMCSLPNGMFRVKLSNERKIVAHVSGKIKLESAKILVGDSVLVQRMFSDSANGRIVHVYSI